MRKLRLVLVALATMAAMVYAGSAATPATPTAPSEHQRIIDFWTPERVAQAVPRDFEFDPGSQRFILANPTGHGHGGGGGGKPGGGGGSTGGDTTGSSWTGGGTVANTTGKVLFEMDGSYWVCSASVVSDTKTDRSIVLTAGHCVYDETNRAFATNWLFVPNYDASPASLSTDQSFCSQTKYGCWTAGSLVVDNGFATAGGFNQQATLNDAGFAVVGPGGFDGNTELDTLGTQNIAFSAIDPITTPTTVWAFGYPAAKKYKGNDLVYCKGPLDTDPYNDGLTYQLACDMTGGSSGGPWFRGFDENTGNGTVMSVNSYGYNGITAMFGPEFGPWTQTVYGSAENASSNTIVDVTVTAP
jgi:V8-like Glu-specific endopeptidase